MVKRKRHVPGTLGSAAERKKPPPPPISSRAAGAIHPRNRVGGQDPYRQGICGFSLSGGIAAGEKHLRPGTLVSIKIGSSLRPIRAQVLMRDARGQGLGFEFAEMDLDERARLRKLLLENKSSAIPAEQEVLAQTSV